MKCKQFLLQKDGNPPGLIEDACQIHSDESSGFLRYAVADGATESYCAGYWATLLTAAYCQGQFENGNFETALIELQEQWCEHIAGRQLPWYAEEKARHGAFAALVGLTIRTLPDETACRSWRALALGDSCLFHYRGGKLIYSMPLQSAVEFSSNPYLISSRSENNVDLANHIMRVDGLWQPGDQFVLMTDAVSCWLLQREQDAASLSETGPLSEIEAMTDESFVAWVETMRSTRQENGKPLMKNDDVTVLHLVLSEEET